MLKVRGWWVVAYSILVSAQGPLVLVFLGFGAKGLGPGLDNKNEKDVMLLYNKSQVGQAEPGVFFFVLDLSLCEVPSL